MCFRMIWNSKTPGRAADSKLYPDLGPQDNATKALWVMKRSIDIIGSLSALILLSPLLIAIAIAIKLTSKGPILFKQTEWDSTALGSHS